MRVLYLVFNEGYSGDIDLAAEAIRLTRQLAALADDPEVHGLLALMLLHHARRHSRTRPDGSIVPLAEQDRSQWDRDLIAEGIVIVHAALARDQLGEYQAQAAIAALHADAARVEETDWTQIVEWYDELLRFADTPIVRLNRAVAVGEADGAPAGLAALAERRRRRPAARGGRRPPPREERRPRARRPPLRRRRSQRAQPRRARPPDPPGRPPQPAAAEIADLRAKVARTPVRTSAAMHRSEAVPTRRARPIARRRRTRRRTPGPWRGSTRPSRLRRWPPARA